MYHYTWGHSKVILILLFRHSQDLNQSQHRSYGFTYYLTLEFWCLLPAAFVLQNIPKFHITEMWTILCSIFKRNVDLYYTS